ncbi:MAG: response regulator transcription factor [bacterium]|nr:response regulator transcription factor [bacterium]MCM1374576.1 response regulator transcription factor [Muribaculum sp.]
MHIFLIEDEPLIRRELKLLLENALYRVTAPEEFQDLVRQVVGAAPDLVLLDVNLPEISGFELCTQLRQQTDVPVIFLTGRTDSMDEVDALYRGGDDYITKPYQAPVLLARIAAVLKRTRSAAQGRTTLLTHNGVSLDIAGCRLLCGEQRIDLTRNEMKLLHLLFQHPGAFVSRMDLIEQLWENHIFIDDNTLSVHIAKLREKLCSVGAEHFIETKRGMGYRI